MILHLSNNEMSFLARIRSHKEGILTLFVRVRVTVKLLSGLLIMYYVTNRYTGIHTWIG